MNKQSPEYIRIREKIAKKFYQVHRGIVNTEKARNLFSREDELSQAFYLLLADSILEIKGIVVISNNQKEPEALPDPHPEWNKGLRFMTWNDCWEATQNEHFKRLVE